MTRPLPESTYLEVVEALTECMRTIDKAYAWQGAAPASPTVPAPKEMPNG